MALLNACLLVVLGLIATVALLPGGGAQPQQRKNVLFFAIDDLRTELGAYNHDQVKSPNIDKLASKSLLFERAYCQVSLCSPSRASLLTGRRPDTNHVWQISADEYWRQFTNATTIPQYFKENGYISIGMGKVFHPGAASGKDDEEYSWSPEGLPYYHSPLEQRYGPANHTSSWWAFEGIADNQQPDGQIADRAVSVLQQLHQNRSKGDNRPFFLAVGFHKPHLPFYAPSRYFDLYPPASEIKLPVNPNPPKDMPDIAWSIYSYIRGFGDTKQFFPNVTKCFSDAQASIYGKECRFPVDKARELRRAYYACVSYTDTQVAKVLAELERQGFSNDTIIVLWGDHGWQLGEHNEWCKFTNFEDGVHVPFLLRVPGVTDGGMRTQALVELIDIFPSVAELAGIKVPPPCPEGEHNLLTCVEGSSVAPLLKNPNQQWKKGAFSQYARPGSGLTSIPGHPPFDNEHGENVMGYTIRVDQYRFTEWVRFNRTTAMPHWDDVWGTELYNHTEPTTFFNDENANLANDPDMQPVVKELRQLLHAEWRAALPP